MTGLRSLNNFFASVQFDNPQLAERIAPDVEVVALYALSHESSDRTPGKEAADRLRRVAFDLPVIQERVLAGALQDLGY
jgi:hypothetical protein